MQSISCCYFHLLRLPELFLVHLVHFQNLKQFAFHIGKQQPTVTTLEIFRAYSTDVIGTDPENVR